MTEQNAREAMEVWREACQASQDAFYEADGMFANDPEAVQQSRYSDQAAASVIAAKLAEKDADIARAEDRAWEEARELVRGTNADLGGGCGKTYRRIIEALTNAINNRNLRTFAGRVEHLQKSRQALKPERPDDE